MSLEAKIEALTQAVTALIAQMQNANVTTLHRDIGECSTSPSIAAPVVTVTPIPTAPAPGMPAPPSFAAPAPVAPVAAGVPFSDGKGLVDYVMNSYKALGAEKGALIQNVLVGLGYQNVNDVKLEHFAALFAGVEALK